MELMIPLGVCVLSFFLFLIYLKEAETLKVLKISKLILSCTILLMGLLYVLVFYDKIKDNLRAIKISNYVFLFGYGILALLYFCLGLNQVSKNYFFQQYYKCIEEDRLYVLLDKNDKIRLASNSIIDGLSLDKKTVIGTNFFAIFDDCFTVFEINDNKFTNKDLRKMFFSLRSSRQEDVIKREIKVYDRKNRMFVLNFSDHVILENGKYKGHILIGDSKTGDDLLNVESELQNKKSDLEKIKLKFSTHLELTEEAIFFYNLDDGYIWTNDVLVRELNLNGNSIRRDDYLDMIHKDDKEYYIRIISNLTSNKPDYDVSYRIKTGANYIFVREYGRRLFDNGCNEIMGYIEPIRSNHYERSNIDELDNVKSTDELMTDLELLYKQGRTFELVIFRINNICEINKEHGRNIGNMIMAEYLKAIWRNFVDDKQIYRTDGLEFTFIITDFRKMDLLNQALKKNQILNATMKYGAMSIQTDVYMGIATSNEVSTSKQLIEAAKKSLKTALMDQVRTNYIYYKDIK